MVDKRRPMAWALSLLVMFMMLAACGGPDERESQRVPTPVPMNRDANLKERLSRLQQQVLDVDVKIRAAATASQQLNAELTALRGEIEGVPAAAPVPAATPAPAMTAAPAQAVAPAVAPVAQPAAQSPTNPFVWIIILIILAVAIVFIVKHFMGMWSEEEDEEWIDEEAGEAEDETIQMSPEVGESAPDTETRNTDDEPKP
ncbi:hypothetical protein LLG95_10355 [bacterium]|nr:hypothetical protein [bacterium]